MASDVPYTDFPTAGNSATTSLLKTLKAGGRTGLLRTGTFGVLNMAFEAGAGIYDELPPAETAVNVAHAIPVAGPLVVDSMKGRPTEAVISATQDVLIYGGTYLGGPAGTALGSALAVGLGGVARPIAQSLGADVDPSTFQMIHAIGGASRQNQAFLHDLVDPLDEAFRVIKENGFISKFPSGKEFSDVGGFGDAVTTIHSQLRDGIGFEDMCDQTLELTSKVAADLSKFLKTNDKARQWVSDLLKQNNINSEEFFKGLDQFVSDFNATKQPVAAKAEENAVVPAGASGNGDVAPSSGSTAPASTEQPGQCKPSVLRTQPCTQ